MRTMRPRVTLQLPSGPLTRRSSALDGASVLLIGHGYVARALRPVLEAGGARVRWTSRDGVGIPFGSEAMRRAFAAADVVVVSVPPARDGRDPSLDALAGTPTRARWIGYLSATSVYGDRAGGWAFEGEAPSPSIARGARRADAELAWMERYAVTQVFRLAGIYGPGRSPFAKLKDGSARVVTGLDGHVVNRIHVDDIVSALTASMERPSAQDIYNIADGHPADPGDVLDFAAGLLAVASPRRVPLDDPSISPMARSFYAETKRVDIGRAVRRLHWVPAFASYREGLHHVWAAEGYG